jgi:tetratricopeptide (TPR) repeat protein
MKPQSRHRLLCAALLLALALLPLQAGAESGELQRAQHLLDSGRPDEALQVLDRLLRQQRQHPEALLLRSTAHFQLDEVEAGKRDLYRALELDPGLRQGWLNRAAVELSEKRHEEALASLQKAQALDPRAPDNHLNIGAVLLLLGRLDDASRSFQEYLSRHSHDARAFYLVASNYAGSGYAGLALQHLSQAVSLDERRRLQARGDPNFSDLFEHPRFLDLMAIDSYRPPAGARHARRSYERPYAGGDGPLLQAVLDALWTTQEPFDPTVEVTAEWALIWGEMRIKVGDGPQGGFVELTAPAERFTQARWQDRSKMLLDSIFVHLQRRGRGPAPGR